MIVKNEECIIRRNLLSSLPLVDTFLIIDTGSTDNTVLTIHEVASSLNKTGTILHRPWVNFGHNRTELLIESRSICDFSLMLDADDYVSGQLPSLDLNSNGYLVPCELGGILFYRPHIFNSKCNWKYQGSVHEYVIGGEAVKTEMSLVIHTRCEGIRSKNPTKYLDDALLLERILSAPSSEDYDRNVFYCAQSYRDAGLLESAKRYYSLRITLEGWHEEVYMSYLNLIRMADSSKEILALAWKGVQCNNQRKDIPYYVLKWHRQRDIFIEEVFGLSYLYVDNKISHLFLFSDIDAYSWSYYDEIGLYAYYTGRKKLAQHMFRRCLSSCPDREVTRITQNLKYE